VAHITRSDGSPSRTGQAPFSAPGYPPIHPDGFVRTHEERYGGLVPPAPHCRLTGSAEALRPATALPVALGGRDSTGYYGLSAPVPALGISHPTLTGAGPGSGVARVATASCGRCPFDPLTWRTRLGTSSAGCKDRAAPALPYIMMIRLRG
jgi:hypothetical protein